MQEYYKKLTDRRRVEIGLFPWILHGILAQIEESERPEGYNEVIDSAKNAFYETIT